MDRIVVLADESAAWKVAGLPQLERIVLALNEFKEAIGETGTTEVVIFWRPDVPASARWLPNDARMKRVRATESFSFFKQGGARIITTRLFVERNGMAQFFQAVPSVISGEIGTDLLAHWKVLHARFEASCRDAVCRRAEQRWAYLRTEEDISSCEGIFLQRMGKPQDGIVSRCFNRPLSRPITRLLLRSQITPTTWTLAMLTLPLVSFPILLHGDYLSILIGTALYQLSSIFDGCDGEIARAKYLESQRGGRVDDFCDFIGGFLFISGLGFGLSHLHGSAFYACEGILWVLIMAANEALLRHGKVEDSLAPSGLTGAMYPRHRQLLEHSGILFLGETTVSALVQLSKRDIGILLYLLLALAGVGEWILHLAIVLAAPGLALTTITRMKTSADRGRVATL